MRLHREVPSINGECLPDEPTHEIIRKVESANRRGFHVQIQVGSIHCLMLCLLGNHNVL